MCMRAFAVRARAPAAQGTAHRPACVLPTCNPSAPHACCTRFVHAAATRNDPRHRSVMSVGVANVVRCRTSANRDRDVHAARRSRTAINATSNASRACLNQIARVTRKQFRSENSEIVRTFDYIFHSMSGVEVGAGSARIERAFSRSEARRADSSASYARLSDTVIESRRFVARRIDTRYADGARRAR